MSAFIDDTARTAHRRQNLVHAVVLVALLAGMLGLAAGILLGTAGSSVAVAFAAALGLAAPRLPASLTMRLYRAVAVPHDNGQLPSLADIIAERAGLSQRPSLFVVPSMTLNAFSAGPRERPAIALSEGLLRRLTLREIAAVVAHEIAHIRAGDLAVLAIADAVTRAFQVFAYAGAALALYNLWSLATGGETLPWAGIAVLYIGPAVSSLVQIALDRAREFHADLDALEYTSDPMGLASALKRVENYRGQIWEDLMLPVPGRRSPQPSMLRTHPPAEERVARLLALGRQPHREPIAIVEKPMVSMVGAGPIELKPRYRFPGLWY